MDKKTKIEKTAISDAKKTSFFARYLAAQELASVSSGQTLKFPSDRDDEDWP